MVKKKSVNRAEDVNLYLKNLHHPLKSEIEAIRTIILKANKKIREQVKWGNLSFLYREGMATIDIKKRKYVCLVFHNGAILDDNSGVLEGDDIDRRTVIFYSMNEVSMKEYQLMKLVNGWVEKMDSYYS